MALSTISSPAAGTRYDFTKLSQGTAINVVISKDNASYRHNVKLYVQNPARTGRVLIKTYQYVNTSVSIVLEDTEVEDLMKQRYPGNGYMYLVLETHNGNGIVMGSTEKEIVLELAPRSSVNIGADAGPWRLGLKSQVITQNENYPSSNNQPWFIDIAFFDGNNQRIYTSPRGKIFDLTLPKENFASLLPGGSSSQVSVKIQIKSYWQGVSGTWYIIRDGGDPVEKYATVIDTSPPPIWNQTFETREYSTAIGNLLGSLYTGVYVEGKSGIYLTIPEAAVTKQPNGASIVSYKIYANGNLVTTLSYSEYTSVSAVITQEKVIPLYTGVPYMEVRIDAIDANNTISSTSRMVNVLPYKPPTSTSMSVKRQNGYLGTFQVSPAGQFSSIKVGGVEKNTVNSITAQIKLSTSSTYTSLGSIPIAQVAFNFFVGEQKSYTGYSETLTYNIRITVTDKLTTSTFDYLMQPGVPIVFYDSVKKSVGFGQFPTEVNTIESSLALKVDNISANKAGTLNINSIVKANYVCNFESGMNIKGPLTSTSNLSADGKITAGGTLDGSDVTSKGGYYYFNTAKTINLRYSSSLNRFYISRQLYDENTSSRYWNESNLEIDTGFLYTDNTANTPKEIQVTFGKTFASAPTVMVSIGVQAAQNITECTVTNVTTTGCTLYFNRTTTVTGNSNRINWLAVNNM